VGTHSPVKGTVETETEAGQETETETETEIESGSETVEVGRGHDQIVPVARRDTTEGDEGVALAEKGDDPGLEAGIGIEGLTTLIDTKTVINALRIDTGTVMGADEVPGLEAEAGAGAALLNLIMVGTCQGKGRLIIISG